MNDNEGKLAKIRYIVQKSLFGGFAMVLLLLSMAVLLLQPIRDAEQKSEATPRQESSQPPKEEVSEPKEPLLEAAPQAGYDAAKHIRMLRNGAVTELPLDEYLLGVVLAEMPASFEAAALEAQAVAARTFTLRRIQSPKHEAADICSDSTCCQQYMDPAMVQEKLGENHLEFEAGVRRAIGETDGLVITYGGQLIDAVYFSCSGGDTEDAAAVWGADVPYLQSVPSPGEEFSTRFSDELRVDLQTFCDTLSAQTAAADFTGPPESWVGTSSRTEGGGVDTIELGGVEFRGTELRSLFSLRSTNFTLELEGEEMVFRTQGYGHRVGMSQYGAQAMASAGAGHEEILLHYYTGVKIVHADSLS